MLSAKKIKKEIKKKNIFISGFNKERLNPNSYDLTLNDTMKVYSDDILDSKTHNQTQEIIIPEEGYVLQPGELYLACTNEHTVTKGFVPRIIGKSSIGRLGISIHQTSGFGDNGFNGTWTMQLVCVKPVRIYPNMKICQIYYEKLHGDKTEMYDGKYQNNNGLQESMNYKNFIVHDDKATAPGEFGYSPYCGDITFTPHVAIDQSCIVNPQPVEQLISRLFDHEDKTYSLIGTLNQFSLIDNLDTKQIYELIENKLESDVACDREKNIIYL